MSFSQGIKRVVIGRKLASSRLGETLLPKRIALPVFASDALSSVAYAPDEIFLTLSLAGMAGFAFSWKIGLAVAVVMLIVVASYRQTVHAYPSGGGDYEVATVNVGPNAGLIVASALLVDYVMTVAVSVSSGVQNAKSMIPFFVGNEGWIAAVVIFGLMAMNLRGVRESGTVFAIPTYCFMVGVIGMTIWGLVRIFVFQEPLQAATAQYEVVGSPSYEPFLGFAMVALLARAFSSGCAALTGVEAIANGVPALREPKSKNAATTLALLGSIAVAMLAGIIIVSNQIGLKMTDPDGHSHFVKDGQLVDVPHMTVMAQLAETVFNNFQFGFIFVITATMVILFLAANTAFNGFPVLASILAKDGYMPRMLYTRGDRLAYSNGIIALASAAIGLVLIFNASVTALIQLYVVGVFVSFTVSQYGMMRHWNRHLATETDPATRAKMQRSRVINIVGLTCTGTVLVVVLLSKFIYGAYLAVIAMAGVFLLMKLIKGHYNQVAEELAPGVGAARTLPSRVRAVVLVQTVNKPTLQALAFAAATRPSSFDAVTVSVDPKETEQIMSDWEANELDLPLTVIASPYREVVGPFLSYVKGLRSGSPRDAVCVYIPEYIVGHWWEQILHNQTGFFIKARLNLMSGVMVTSVPYLLNSSKRVVEKESRVAGDPLAWRKPGMGVVHTGEHVAQDKRSD